MAKMIQKNFRMPEPLVEALTHIAYEKRLSQTKVLEEALAEHFLTYADKSKDDAVFALLNEYEQLQHPNPNPEPESKE